VVPPENGISFIAYLKSSLVVRKNGELYAIISKYLKANGLFSIGGFERSVLSWKDDIGATKF
jgi:hypothetical protein